NLDTSLAATEIWLYALFIGCVLAVAMSCWIFPVAMASEDSLSNQEQDPSTDLLGDILPSQARTRFGSTRFRQPGWTRSIAYSRDGKTIATGSSHGDVRMWDALTGKELPLLSDTVGCRVAFSPDGKMLAASGYAEGQVRIWDIPGRSQPQVLRASTLSRLD